jgi:hypothetical protein
MGFFASNPDDGVHDMVAGAIGGIKSLNQDNLFTIKWLSYYKKGEIVC